mgnify:CR=1 FL=1
MGTFPNGTVRVSPGYFTAAADIDDCLEALRDVARQYSSALQVEPSLMKGIQA